MAELSGTAKLSNGTPASRIVAVHPLRGHIRTATPGAGGAYAIPGVPKGEWLVTALGPSGYWPQTHILNVDRTPEAESLFPRIYASWGFEGSGLDEHGGQNVVGDALYVPGYRPDSLGATRSSAGRASLVQPPITGLTISVWIGLREPSASARIAFDLMVGANQSVTQLRLSSTQIIAYRIRRDQGTLLHTATAARARGPLAFEHVLIYLEPGRFEVDCNGASVFGGTNNVANNPLTGTDGIQLSASDEVLTIDDLMIFAGRLSDIEKAYIYNGGTGRHYAEILTDAGF